MLRWLAMVGAVVALGAGSAGAAPADDRAWVEMAPEGGSVVRVLTASQGCPVVRVDGHTRAMTVRAVPETMLVRDNKAGVADGARFSALVCELPLPRNARHAMLAGRALPLPSAVISRIVVIGDTGCRLKEADKAWQGCNVEGQWPFAAIAARAAALHPDMVLHVGDYLYRENPCPAGQDNCKDAAWGYGEAGWRADFLDPAAPLLAAAPWAMVRGNHEECARAGQGWWRLLDPHALLPGRDCRNAANDASGDHAEPYAVSLGGEKGRAGAAVIIADLVGLASQSPKDTATVTLYQNDLAQVARLARRSQDSFVAAHYPFNAVMWDKRGGGVAVGTKPVSAFAPLDLKGVRAMLAGHIHMFQVARFNDRPAQVITGFSGTQEDAGAGPASMDEVAGKPGAAPLTALTTVNGRFGYALLERGPHRRWQLTAYNADGSVMGHFDL